MSKHVNRKLSGRKRCTTNWENCSLMRIVKQNRFKNLGELHKEWTEAGVKASRAPHTDVSRNLATVVIRGVLPGLSRRRTGLLPSGTKSSFQMRASFVFHLETKVLESGGRVEKLIAQVAWSPVLSLNYFSLCAFNLFNTRVSQFELNYGKKWTFLIFCWICIL